MKAGNKDVLVCEFCAEKKKQRQSAEVNEDKVTSLALQDEERMFMYIPTWNFSPFTSQLM